MRFGFGFSAGRHSERGRQHQQKLVATREKERKRGSARKRDTERVRLWALAVTCEVCPGKCDQRLEHHGLRQQEGEGELLNCTALSEGSRVGSPFLTPKLLKPLKSLNPKIPKPPSRSLRRGLYPLQELQADAGAPGPWL